jgi:hypothetical protein
VDDVRRVDARLAQAIKLPVPEGLKERVLLRRSIAGNRTRRLGYELALAAGLVLAIALGLSYPRSEDGLRDAVAAYVQQHAVRDPAGDTRLSRDTVNAALHEVGIELNQGVGEIAFAKPCDIYEGRGAHLIVPGERGPVTVLIMPEANVRQEVMLRSGNLIGKIVPCPRGSIAIVGTKDEALDVIHQRMEGAINWI